MAEINLNQTSSYSVLWLAIIIGTIICPIIMIIMGKS